MSMSINYVNGIYNNKYIKTKSIQSTKPTIESRIRFCGGLKADIVDINPNIVLSKFKRFSIAEYKTLTEREKSVLREEYHMLNKTEDDKYIEELHDIFSDKLESNFDKKYGKGKYKVIVIGRSLSSIGKVLGYKIGEENVINIPMTSASQYLNNRYIEVLKEKGDIDKFRDFLASVGLTKEKIQSSDKKYIILDYCVSGDSLKGAKNLLTRDDLLGSKNIVTKDVMKCITNKNLRRKSEGTFFACDLKQYSLIKKTPYIYILNQRFVNPQEKSLKAQLMLFKLLDNQMVKSNKNIVQSFFSRIKSMLKD